MKKFKWVVGIILLCYLLFYATFNFIQPDLTVRYLGWKPYVVLTDSMEPALPTGSLVIATWKKPEELTQKNIVVVAPRNRDGVVHYMAAKSSDEEGFYLRTRPYRAKSPDQWDYWKIRKNQYLGVVSFSIPYAGRFLMFMKSPAGIIVIVLILLSIAVYKRLKLHIES